MYLADEVFLSGTAAELVPVREVDDHRSAPASRARSRACCRRAFDDAIHGRTERYREWLDVVPMRAERPARRPPGEGPRSAEPRSATAAG